MKKLYKMVLVGVVAFFALSITPLVENNHQSVAQAASTKIVRHKKAKKRATKKHNKKKGLAKRKRKATKKRRRHAKKHVVRKVRKNKKTTKRAKKHVAKKVRKNKKATKHVRKHKAVKKSHKKRRIAKHSKKRRLSKKRRRMYKRRHHMRKHMKKHRRATKPNASANIAPKPNTSTNVAPKPNTSTNVASKNNNNVNIFSNVANPYKDNAVDDVTMDNLFEDASSTVSSDREKGIKPHISPDQSMFVQLAEFKYIVKHNEKVHLESEFKNVDKQDDDGFGNRFRIQSRYDFNNKTVTIQDVDNPTGKTFNFNQNEKYIPSAFEEVKDEEAKGIKPHISSDQSHIKQFAEFQNIVANNENQKIESKFDDTRFTVQHDLPTETVSITEGESEEPTNYQFNPNEKYITSAFEEVKDDDINGIKPHISSDQSAIKQFAEFEEITVDNAKHDRMLHNQSNDVSVYRDLPQKSITLIFDNNNPDDPDSGTAGPTYTFNPNAKLNY